MSQDLIQQYGDALYHALTTRTPIAPLSSRGPAFSLEDAYRVQQRFIERRLQAGESVIGKKIGLTSRAVMNMLGVDQPDFGQLLSGMLYNDGESVPVASLIAPRAEGEIAFVLKRDLIGPGLTAADVLAATEGVMACFEVVDSRIADWKIQIQDTVADNASCGVFVLGNQLVSPRGLDLSLVGMALEKNGELVATGAGAASLGHPVNAMVWLANKLGSLGIPLKAGEVILSGSLAALVPVKVGDCLHMSLGGLGSCTVRFD
ncbi:2-oxopent-4-enoate hydratase [Aquitalea denitrificans]|uniref:2-oxopent-4-enoate hydratase n=1 Tax=Aquitalea denitrificans TaxID=519081 RepID=UPI0013575DB6|nr:2-oxopent-4-enoate hydratase [Aquitalea denitrificans]